MFLAETAFATQVDGREALPSRFSLCWHLWGNISSVWDQTGMEGDCVGGMSSRCSPTPNELRSPSDCRESQQLEIQMDEIQFSTDRLQTYIASSVHL